MITSPDNEKLKTIRKLRQKRWREKLGLFAAEGEDLVEAAQRAGWEPEFVLWAEDEGEPGLVRGESAPRLVRGESASSVEPQLLAGVSTLGSGTRVIGIYRARWAEAWGEVLVYLHGVEDPGNVGTIIRSAHALADATVVLGAACADPFSPKAVRASMGSIFSRPPARASFEALAGHRIALDSRSGGALGEIPLEDGPTVLCLGAERKGLPAEVLEAADVVARIPLRAGGPDSLNVAMAATVALYEVERRMRGHA